MVGCWLIYIKIVSMKGIAVNPLLTHSSVDQLICSKTKYKGISFVHILTISTYLRLITLTFQRILVVTYFLLWWTHHIFTRNLLTHFLTMYFNFFVSIFTGYFKDSIRNDTTPNTISKINIIIIIKCTQANINNDDKDIIEYMVKCLNLEPLLVSDQLGLTRLLEMKLFIVVTAAH